MTGSEEDQFGTALSLIAQSPLHMSQIKVVPLGTINSNPCSKSDLIDV